MAKRERILAGQTAAITGAARGIGRATAQALTRVGVRVAIGDLDLEAARKTASELGPTALALSLDVTERDSFARFLDETEAQLGPVDVLINNAGIMQVGRFLDEDDLTARRMVDINLHGVILGMKLGPAADGRARARAHREHLLAGRQVRGARRRDILRDQARRRRTDRGGARRVADDGPRRRRAAELRDAVRRQHRTRRRSRAGAGTEEPAARRSGRRDRRCAPSRNRRRVGAEARPSAQTPSARCCRAGWRRGWRGRCAPIGCSPTPIRMRAAPTSCARPRASRGWSPGPEPARIEQTSSS